MKSFKTESNEICTVSVQNPDIQNPEVSKIQSLNLAASLEWPRPLYSECTISGHNFAKVALQNIQHSNFKGCIAQPQQIAVDHFKCNKLIYIQ